MVRCTGDQAMSSSADNAWPFDFDMLREVDAVISAFERAGIRYALAGGFAVADMGGSEPRKTWISFAIRMIWIEPPPAWRRPGIKPLPSRGLS